jgi:uncharacterized beta-barrel protein YwiB (DUF1934 family)
MALKSVIATINDGDQRHTIEEKAWGNPNDFTFVTANDEKHHLKVLTQRVVYERQSDVSFQFTFEENALHEGEVTIAEGTLPLQIFTTSLQHSDDTIYIAYQIQDNGEILSQHSITIQLVSGD